MSNRYAVLIYWSADDGCYIGEVPELPGCMADGSSYQDVAANLDSAIDTWIETAKSLGRTVPQPTPHEKRA